MGRLLVLLCLLFVAGHASAAGNDRYQDLDGLTELQKAQIATQVAQAKIKSNGQDSDTPTPQKISQWATLGTDLGKALVSTAKELGVAVNDFIHTPVGKIAAVIIIYKLVGKDVIHLGFGSVFLVIAGSLWFYAFRRVCLIDSVVVTSVTEGAKTTKTRQVLYGRKWKDLGEGTLALFIVGGLGIFAVGMIILFTY